MVRLHSSGSLVCALALAACGAAPSPPVVSPVQEQMFAHFALARDLRTFAVNGDLERIRITASELTDTDPTWGLPPGADRYREELHEAARRAAGVQDPAGAAQAVAEVAAACGTCHLANDATLGERFQVAAPLMDDPSTRHTNYLSWTSRLLWDGLIGPSERMWRTGAGALAGGEGVPAPRGSYVPADEVSRSAALIRELGVEAVTANTIGERVRILAEVWSACADCHIQAGVR